MMKMTRDQWQLLFEQWRASGLSCAEFARQNNLQVKTFYNQKGRLGFPSQAPAKKKQPARAEKFLPLTVKADSPSPEKQVKIVTARGVSVEIPVGTDTAWFKQLILSM